MVPTLPRDTQSWKFATYPTVSSNFFHKTCRYYCNQDGCSFPSTKLGMMRGIWNRTALYDSENQVIKKLLHLSKVQTYVKRTLCTCHQMLPASLNTDHYKNSYKCVQNVILTDIYFSYCCSLNHSYIYRQLVRQWLVLSITRRERKQTSYYRKTIFLLYWSSKQTWWYCMGADFNYTTSYKPFMGLLYIKCYDHIQQTIYTRDSWSVLVYPYIQGWVK